MLERDFFLVNWKVVMASKNNGGLDIGSLVDFNEALLLKWRLRFVNYIDALWVKAIKSIHGVSGGFDLQGRKLSIKGVWASMVSNCCSFQHCQVVFG